MKHKSLLTILIASSMMVVGCNKENPTGPNISLDEFKTAISEGILGTQNYSAHITARFKGDSEDYSNFNMYNINDDAIFDDASSYFYNGYIRQKDQGIVDFQMLKAGEAVIPGEFYATDPNMDMHDFYPAAPSNIFADLNTYSKNIDNKFKSTDTHAMAVIANLGLGLHAMWASNPTDFTVIVNKDFSKVEVKSEFIYNYQSEEAGNLDNTFVQTPVYINVTFTSIGTTSFPSIEAYVENPDYVFPTPTAWSEADIEMLKNNFNKEVPPFIEGLSYAYEMKTKGTGNNFYTLVVDYASGDLSSAYGQALEGLGFSPVNQTTKYQKAIEEEQSKTRHVYTVEMIYHNPDEVMDPETGEKWGFCYPNGVFEAKFSYKRIINIEVKTVQDLMSYLEGIDVSQFFVLDDVNAASEVKGFSDGTVIANQSEEKEVYYFSAPTGTGTFKIYLSYADALKFYNGQKEYLASCSDLSFSESSLFGVEIYSSDDGYTLFQLLRLKGFNESTYPGYVEMRVKISHEFYEAHCNDRPASKIRINYKVLNQEDKDVTADALSYSSTFALKAEKNSTVNLSAALNNGYTFVQYEPVEPEESDKTVQAQIEAGTFVNTNAISSFVAPTYDFTMVIRVNELDPSIGRLSSISVEGQTTQYIVGQSYSFNGRVMAHYTTGDVDVTSQAIISDNNVNTSKAGTYDVLVSFTDENGQSASTTIKIKVVPATTYKVNVKPVPGVEILTSSATSLPGNEITFTVTQGESLIHEMKVFGVSGTEVTLNYREENGDKVYYFEMPSEEVVITPIKEVSTDTLVGSYSIMIPMTTAGYYNKYTITFNSDGTGSYSREWHNGNPTTYNLYFSYVVSGSNITVQLTGFDNGVDNINFQAGYRLFVSSTVVDPENPDFKNLNPTGVRNNKYSVTFSLVNSSGDIANTVNFYRE